MSKVNNELKKPNSIKIEISKDCIKVGRMKFTRDSNDWWIDNIDDSYEFGEIMAIIERYANYMCFK